MVNTKNPEAQAKTKSKGHLSGDERYKSVDLTMKRFKYEKDALLEVLNTAQETFGYLLEDMLVYVASRLNVPLSQVYGVATFYHMFTFKPLGEHNCIVCTGTACHVKGSEQIVLTLGAEYGVKPGSTTPDGKFSLSTARCMGSCGLAPVIVIDGEIMGKQTPESAVCQVKEFMAFAAEQGRMEREGQ